jgi:hypothetical protein
MDKNDGGGKGVKGGPELRLLPSKGRSSDLGRTKKLLSPVTDVKTSSNVVCEILHSLTFSSYTACCTSSINFGTLSRALKGIEMMALYDEE